MTSASMIVDANAERIARVAANGGVWSGTFHLCPRGDLRGLQTGYPANLGCGQPIGAPVGQWIWLLFSLLWLLCLVCSLTVCPFDSSGARLVGVCGTLG